jgi:hypothetical protein
MSSTVGFKQNYVEMGFSEGPHQGYSGNFVEIRFSEDLH